MIRIRTLWAESPESELLMTTLAAGSMGKSWEPGHPRKLEIYRELGIDPERILFVEQQHTRDVQLAGNLKGGTGRPAIVADGIISADPGHVLGVTAADCMPIFLNDTETGVRALLHSGWKGTGIALEALRIMAGEYGCRPENIQAVLGPAIGSCCYNVDGPRAAEFAERWGDQSVRRIGGKAYLSLSSANSRMLEAAGVGSIKIVDECTCCGENLGSFRREGADGFTLMMVLSICI